MSAPAVAECLIVLTARHGPVARTVFERVRTEIKPEVAHFTPEDAVAAVPFFNDDDFPDTDLEFGGGVIG